MPTTTEDEPVIDIGYKKGKIMKAAHVLATSDLPMPDRSFKAYSYLSLGRGLPEFESEFTRLKQIFGSVRSGDLSSVKIEDARAAGHIILEMYGELMKRIEES